MIIPTTPPLETIAVGNDPEKKVLRYGQEGYTESFGYEWEQYPRTYDDESLGANVSKSRLEYLLGFPLEFLSGKNVLELGCGSGRFTPHLADYAKSVVAADLSRAVYHNAALGRGNALFLQADLRDIPPLSEAIDVVICRGVVQHTPEPKATLKHLFDYVNEGGLVVFDVYKKTGSEWRNPKYFWRPIMQKYVSIEKFNAFITKHDRALYKWHHRILRFLKRVPPLKRLVGLTPFVYGINWDEQYPHFTYEQKLAVFKTELIDGLYAHFDQPMTPQEVIDALSEIGQIPYSHDIDRNQFRYKKTLPYHPIKLKRTRNGVVPASV